MGAISGIGLDWLSGYFTPLRGEKTKGVFMKRIMLIFPILSLLLVGNCGSNGNGALGQFVNPDTVSLGLNYILTTAVAKEVDESIRFGNANAYWAWAAAEQSIREVLLPALTGTKVQVTEVRKWIDQIFKDNLIRKEESEAIQKVINMILGMIDPKPLDDLMKKNKVSAGIQKVLLSGFETFQKIIKETLDKPEYADLKKEAPRDLGKQEPKSAKLEFRFTG